MVGFLVWLVKNGSAADEKVYGWADPNAFDGEWGRKSFAAAEKVREAAKRGAQIICIDELFGSEYFCREENADLFALAESIPGPTTEALAAVAKEKSVALVVSVFERRAAGVYHNSAVVIDADGSMLGRYRKMHIPDDPLYFEKFYFTPGDLGFPVFDTKYARIGVQICWDQWYPEGARLVALQGAQVIFYPTSIGWHPSEKKKFGAAQLDAWQTIQRSHAIANGTLRRRRESRGIRRHEEGGPRILGPFVRC